PWARRARASRRSRSSALGASPGGPGGSGSTSVRAAATRRSASSAGRRPASCPLLLVERPLGRVVVLLLHEERDAAHLVELLEVARLPRGEERDQREAGEDEEGVHHPVGHHPARLLRLGRVVREGERGPG